MKRCTFIPVARILALSLILYALPAIAHPSYDTIPDIQKNDTILTGYLDEVTITATKYQQVRFHSPRTLTIANEQYITDKNRFSVLDALNDQIGVWIEKRTTTASDPVIRGLSGGNVLAIIDGGSLSTFWGEGGFAGDDMYGKIDGESIARIEVIRGPASLIYGSNALGGVIHFITKTSPLGYTDKGFQSGGKVRSAYGSSSKYLMGRVETWGASPAFRYFIGATHHRSDDMRAGGGMGVISPSGGRDASFDVNMETRVRENQFITLSGQLMNRPELYRYYRPTQSNTNQRFGLNAGYRNEDTTAWADVFKLNLYHQYKKDTRAWYTDKTLETIREEGYAWWKTTSADFHAVKSPAKNMRLLYGARYYLDVAESPDDEQFTMITPAGDQKATPETRWNNAGVYIHHEWDVAKPVTLTAGLRYDNFVFRTNDDIFYTKPGDPDTLKNIAGTDASRYSQDAVTGSASAVFHAGESCNIATTWAHGFRMFPPSFGFRQTGQGVLVPNGLLDPVTADMFEVSPRLRARWGTLIVTGYYTSFRNFQQPIHGEYKGSDYIDYNNNGSFEPDERVYVNTANGDAYVTGVEAETDLSLEAVLGYLKGLHLKLGAMYNYGKMQFPGSDAMPLRQTHPPFAVAKLRYDHPSARNPFWMEISNSVAGRYTEIDPSRLTSDVGYLEDPQDPTSGLYRDYGLPAYSVLDFRAGFTFARNFYLTMAIENITDIRYRSAHSRMDASGRNFLAGLEWSIGKFE